VENGEPSRISRRAPGEIHRRELRTQTWKAIPRAQGGGYDFSETDYHWHCEDGEIDAIREFLNGELPSPGRYKLVATGSEIAELISLVAERQVTSVHVAQLIQLAGHSPDLAASLAASESGALLAEAIKIQRRRAQLRRLRELVEDPASTERGDLHPQLKKMGWIFGGSYIGESARHQLTVGDVLDIPLLPAGRITTHC
jgi:hypothetical protein